MIARAFSALALAAGLTVAACERVDVAVQNEGKNAGGGLTAGSESGGGSSLLAGNGQASAGAPSLIERIADSRRNVAFVGVRRIESHYVESGGNGAAHQLSLRERVSADGHGGFAIEALDVLDPQMSTHDRDLLLSLQSIRQGMNWRYRDFAIQDPELFEQNYTATATGANVVIAGVTCLELRIERIDQSGTLHMVAVDSTTGLVLASRETTLDGQPVSQMVFESLQLAPDLSGVVWHQRTNQEIALPITGDVTAQLGFEPLSPRFLPSGYQLIERARIQHPMDQTPWAKLTYSDGVDSLFFLHGGPLLAGNGVSSGTPAIQADLVVVAEAEPWTVAQGNLHGQRVIAMGKVGESSLLDLLRSAFP